MRLGKVGKNYHRLQNLGKSILQRTTTPAKQFTSTVIGIISTKTLLIRISSSIVEEQPSSIVEELSSSIVEEQQ